MNKLDAKNMVKYVAISSCLLSTNYVLGTTALHVAVRAGNLAGVRAALAQNANVNAPDEYGWTPLHQAAWEGHVAVVQVLLGVGADVKAQISDGFYEGYTALHVAAEKGRVETVRALLGKGAGVNAAPENGWTPLHKAAEYGNAGVVQVLLEKGANANASDEGGYTALHLAAQNGHVAAVQVLLDATGIKVNAQLSDGRYKDRTALDLAELCPPERREEMVALLRAHGAKTRRESELDAELARLDAELAAEAKEGCVVGGAGISGGEKWEISAR
jgi:cytohesin